jgi:hypothetical protein
MNEPIKRVVEAVQQLPDNIQQIVAGHFVWEIKETDWDAIARQSRPLDLAEKLYSKETVLNNSTREPLTERERAE